MTPNGVSFLFFSFLFFSFLFFSFLFFSFIFFSFLFFSFLVILMSFICTVHSDYWCAATISHRTSSLSMICFVTHTS